MPILSRARCSKLLTSALLISSALASLAARADLPASLMEELANPIIRLAMGSSAEGHAVAERMLGETAILRPGSPEQWHSQTQRMVDQLLARQGAGAADEVYLRLVRLEYRFRQLAPEGSVLASGADTIEITADELALAQRLAGEELALRQPGWLERLRGAGADLGGRLEFAPVESEGAGAFINQRQRFLLGQGGGAAAGEATAYDRAITGLRQLVAGREAPYLIFRTPQGKQLMDLVYGPGPRIFNGIDPAEDFVQKLAADPAHRDLALQLSFRLNRAVERYDLLKAKMGFNDRGKVRAAVLDRLARDELALVPAATPGALRFGAL